MSLTLVNAETEPDLAETQDPLVKPSSINPSPIKPSPITPSLGRIVIATINRLQGNTGVHTHTAALCDGLRAEGVRCDVVTPFDNACPWLALFAVRPLLLDRFWPSQSIHWYRHWHGAALRRSLRRYLREKKVSQIIAQCPVSAKAAIDVIRELGGKSSIKITLVCHFNHSEAREYRELGQLRDEIDFQEMLDFESDVLNSVDRVVYVSQWARDVVEGERRIIPRSSAVIHNGIQPTAASKPELSRADVGAAVEDLILINVGTLERRKNQLGLLDLFAGIVNRQPRARLVLVGDGPDRAEIEERVRVLGLVERVILLGRRTDVPLLLILADLYIHYSTAENCPMVILEAARAGLPWAAIPVAGIRELQREIGGCIAIEPDDLAGSADNIAAVLGDRVQRKQLGQSAHERFLDGFTRRRMVCSYLELLQSNQTDAPGAEVLA